MKEKPLKEPPQPGGKNESESWVSAASSEEEEVHLSNISSDKRTYAHTENRLSNFIFDLKKEKKESKELAIFK